MSIFSYVKAKKMTTHEVQELKEARRRKANRQYARALRNKRMNIEGQVESDTEDINPERPLLALLREKVWIGIADIIANEQLLLLQLIGSILYFFLSANPIDCNGSTKRYGTYC
jgi:hypothetical protein